MIQNDHQLKVTLDAIATFYKGLAELRRDKDRYHPSWFAVMAEGPLEDIRRMEAEVNQYTGRLEVEALVADLWVRVEGEGVHWPGGQSSIMSASLHAVRKSVQSITEYRHSGRIGTKPSLRVAKACDLQVRTFAPGSIQFGLQLPEGDEELAAGESVAALGRVAAWAAQEQPPQPLSEVEEDFELRAVVLSALAEIAPGERSRLRFVELSGRAMGGRTVRLDVQAHQRVRHELEHTMEEEPARYTGTLREADLDAGTFTLRQVDGGGELPCRFPPELRPKVARAMDQRVQVKGILRTTATGRKHKRMLVQEIHPIT